MAFQLTRGGLVSPDATEISRLAVAYRENACIHLPRLVERRVVEWLQQRMAAATWKTIVHADLDPPAIDLMLEDDVGLGAIVALTASRALFDLVERITGCGRIGSYGFRVYRMDPGAGHTDTWHGDDDGNRLVTLSVNLGLEPFAGGALEIRERGTGRVIYRVANTGSGDAILFRIGDDLDHRVTEVTGDVPKYAIAGWFQRAPDIDLARLVRGQRGSRGNITGHFL